MARVFSSSSTDKAINALDRKREKERMYMLSMIYKNADELATKLVQRLLDQGIIETNSAQAMREVFTDLLRKISDMEEFDLQFKIAPIRSIATDPNFISLYVTQYIIEDLLENPKVLDVFGDDLEIYNVVESVLSIIRPK
jgi:hypothetical protein